MSLSISEIESLLESHEDKYGDSGWSVWAYERDGDTAVPRLGTVKLMPESKPGREGGGEEIYLIFGITFEDGTVRYFEKDGYYASYDGSTYDGEFTEVRPVERMVTFYE